MKQEPCVLRTVLAERWKPVGTYRPRRPPRTRGIDHGIGFDSALFVVTVLHVHHEWLFSAAGIDR